jgi:hypothetical protein
MCATQARHGPRLQDLFGGSVTYSSESGDLARLMELSIDDAPQRAPFGDRVRSLLAYRRDARIVWPLCFTVVQGSQAEAYFAVHFVEDRMHNAPSYSEYLHKLRKGLSLG